MSSVKKPMTRFVAEGRAVVNAFKRYGRVFQINLWSSLAGAKDKGSVLKHKIMTSGLLKDCQAVRMKKGRIEGQAMERNSGIPPQTIPEQLDWDLYCGHLLGNPTSRRTGGTHRGYWDYEGGGMCDMGQHHYDPEQWTYGKDHTSPVEITLSRLPLSPRSHGHVGLGLNSSMRMASNS